MGKFKDLTGMKFGRLTVIERAEKPTTNKSACAFWKCRCDCGNEIVVGSHSLTSGNTKSCNCSRKGINRKHGQSDSPIYAVWMAMKDRCNNSNNKGYPRYGGRGIKVCERWLDFQNFYDDVSKLEHFGEKGYSLDRIDNNGNYEPSNVRWADRKTQCCNQRTNHIVNFNGETLTLKDASRKSGINYGTLVSRFYAGDRGDRLFRPVKKSKN